jgi:hypothetical protein
VIPNPRVDFFSGYAGGAMMLSREREGSRFACCFAELANARLLRISFNRWFGSPSQ